MGRAWIVLYLEVVARDGIEPPTPAFSGPRSTTELSGLGMVLPCGAAKRARTGAVSSRIACLVRGRDFWPAVTFGAGETSWFEYTNLNVLRPNAAGHCNLAAPAR